jgi:hypothetical protein
MAKFLRVLRRLLERAGHFRTAVWIAKHAGAGGLIAVVVAAVQKLRSQLDWVLIGVVFFVSSFVLYMSMRLQNRKSRDRATSPTRVEPRAPFPGLPSALPPATPKIAIRVVDAVAGSRHLSVFVQPQIFVALRLRAVNTREPAVTIRSWSLELEKPDGSCWKPAYDWVPQGKLAFQDLTRSGGKDRQEESIDCLFRERTSKVPWT